MQDYFLCYWRCCWTSKWQAAIRSILILLSIIGVSYHANAQNAVNFPGNTLFTYYLHGGGTTENNIDMTEAYQAGDIQIVLRATSGIGDGSGIGGCCNPVGYLYWAFNDGWGVAMYAADWGGGLNYPYLYLGGKAYNPYTGGWDPDNVIIALGEWWPNDNLFHTVIIHFLQGGGRGSGIPLGLSVSAEIDDGYGHYRNMPNIAIAKSTTYGDFMASCVQNCGEFNLGYNSTVSISRFTASDGVEILLENSPIYWLGSNPNENFGWGDEFFFINPYGANVTFTIDQCGPGC